MPKKAAKLSAHLAPMPDERSVESHYQDLVDPALTKPTPAPTPPGAEPMAAGSLKSPDNSSDKQEQLSAYRVTAEHMPMTTSLGVKIAHNQNSLSAGPRGPVLLEDFLYQEKMAHFDRERIPERVVHARGSGAHGYFQVYKSLKDLTKAEFLQDPNQKTPVFVRFSTVQGFRGSADTVRDIRGFSTKFYTREGNFDLVGNDTPVFFIQDAIKFPDFVHAVKPEPNNEIPQGQSAHDTFWDYVSLQPETLHNVMWAMSDRGIPRSYRNIEGFGIHTYRMVNADGHSRFVRFHWKPVYGKASLIWDEAQLITGRDPDFHRKDLWQGIEAGDYPEFELGLQIMEEKDAEAFDFDILDATKLIPESLVPVTIVGKMILNRNPDNFFAETEQVAFCPANIVPGIDFSEDPLLQGRVFSYVDTQRHRLGTANFNELPINRPLVPVRNEQRDGFFRTRIDIDAANYEPNSISGNWPREVPPADRDGGFTSHATRVHEAKVRLRSPSFADYYSHPRLFWRSLTDFEQQHMIDAFRFELGKVIRPYIRERVVDLLTRVDTALAAEVAAGLGIVLTEEQLSRELPKPVNTLERDPALSLYATGKQVLKARRVALLVADGVSGKSVDAIRNALKKEGMHPQIFAPHLGEVETQEGGMLKVDGSIEGNPSVLVDAVIVPDGKSVEILARDGNARYYLAQAYKHLKAIGLPGAAWSLAQTAGLLVDEEDDGLVTAEDSDAMMKVFFKAASQHRVWAREAHIASLPA